MKIAVVGAGVSGLVAADRLCREHEVTIFEAGDYAGGHTNTVDVEIGDQSIPVDTGFIVFNESTYPNFCALLDELGVASGETSMSFGVSCPVSGFEYGTIGLGGWMARRKNLLDPRLYRLVRDIFRFFREADRALDIEADVLAEQTLAQFLDARGFSETFRQFYIVPMTAAVWSAPPSTALDFPALTLFTFLRNHGLLTASGAPTWRYIKGGSRSYVQALQKRYRGQLRLSAPVADIKRTASGVSLSLKSGEEQAFDRVVIATHSDQALALLSEPSDAEREVLGAIAYQANEAILHTDEAMLPRHRGAWASWNYLLDPDPALPASLTYHMNRLQSLPTEVPICVSLNSGDRIRPEHIIRRIQYSHPVYTQQTVAAQQRWQDLADADSRVAYCGAYWFYGFHEDGVRSGLRAAQAISA